MPTSSLRADGAHVVATEHTDTGDSGRIWIHRPFRIAPLPTPATPMVVRCPLPKATPPSAPEDKIHRTVAAATDPGRAIAVLQRSKAELFGAQFRARVAPESRRRVQRRVVRSPRGAGEVGVTIYVPGDDDDARARGLVHAPHARRRGICLHVHGGGWLWGDSHDQVAHRCLEMANAMNVAVVSVEYSLLCRANEHRAANNDERPQFDPVNDVLIAMDWIEAHGARELNTGPSLVASGESSGAHLLLLAMLDRRERTITSSPTAPPAPSATPRWKCLNLVYGVFDLSGTPSIRSDGDSSSPLCGNDLLWMYDLYHSQVQQSIRATNRNDLSGTEITQRTIDQRDPLWSPLYANLVHMPPALITVGTADPLLDDSLFMAHRYGACGNHVELAIYEGGEHGIGHFGGQEDEEMGMRARAHTLEFMEKFL